MSLVYVQTFEHQLVNECDDGPYADWRIESNFQIDGVSLDNKLRWGYEAIQIAPAVVEGDTVWVLYCEYSEGDSFGAHSGQGECIWVFTEEDVAQKALAACEGQGRNRYDQFKFEDEDGETLYVGNPGRGDYFSRFQGAYLTECVVGQCPPPRYVEQYLEGVENPC